MITDYQIQAATPRCARSGRELRPGERIHSVLRIEGGAFLREDIAPEHWHGPPAGVFAHWVGRVPSGSKPRKMLIDDEVLVECLARLQNDPDPTKQRFRYVLALLLIRRKRMRLLETTQEAGVEILHLGDPKTAATYTVPDPQLADDELEAVQDEVFRVLGWDC
ncbi:MAG: hypothetical protein SNJ82_00335 [Gemmataceae bacterium]